MGLLGTDEYEDPADPGSGAHKTQAGDNRSAAVWIRVLVRGAGSPDHWKGAKHATPRTNSKDGARFTIRTWGTRLTELRALGCACVSSKPRPLEESGYRLGKLNPGAESGVGAGFAETHSGEREMFG